jgi:uncharacterized protein
MSCLRPLKDGVEITIKVVPGASRSRIAGLLGDALKIQVSAPPEQGKATAAAAAMLVKALGVEANDVIVLRGATTPRKTILIRGRSEAEVAAALGIR